MPRRGENIYRRKDGRWEGRYIADRKPDGGALYRSVYGTTYADVRQKLAVCREENRKQQLRGCTLTVKELLAHWQAENSHIKPTSRERYRALIQQHIEPELGAQRVCDLTEEKLNSFVDRKLKSGRLDGKGGLAPKTVNDICVIVRSALKLARRKFRYNGEEEIRAPAVKQRRIETFSGWECCRISAEILRKPSVENLAYLLCLETGIRLGEVCALQWSDIDFSGGTVHIQRTAYRINYGGRTELVIQTPKSECSERVIPLTAKMLSLLRPLKTSGYLLTGSDRPMEPRTLQYRFRRFLERLEIPVRNFHILRHSCATRCIEYGMDIKSLSEILGHADVQTTLRMYVHPSMESKRSALELASTLSGIA